MKRSIYQVFLFSLIMGIALSACAPVPAKETGKPAETQNTEINNEPINLTIVIRHIGFTKDNNNMIAQELNKRMNMNINWELKPSEQYPQQCTILIASGNYPDAMEYWSSQYPNELQQMADDRVIRPLDDLITKYGQEFTEEVRPDFTWFKSSTDGLRYTIPTRYQETLNNSVLQIRSDWLEKLNLKVPDTSDEMFEALTAFMENSDMLVGKGNQLIPYGGIQNWGLGLQQHIFSENGFVADWNLVDGKVVYYVNMPGYKEALRTMRKFYQNGLIEPEYPLMNREQYLEKWYQNKYGSWQNYVDNLDPVSHVYMPIYISAVPEAEMEFIYPFPDRNGVRRIKGNVMKYHAVIFAETPDDKAAAVVKLMNYMVSEEGSDLVEMGIKDVHWKEDETGKAIFEAPSTNEEKGKIGFYSYNWFSKRWYFPRWNSDITLNTGKEYAQYAVIPPVNATTPEALANGAVLSDIVSTSETELICSASITDFDAAFDAYVKQWNDSGGKQWTAEMNDVYNQNK